MKIPKQLRKLALIIVKRRAFLLRLLISFTIVLLLTAGITALHNKLKKPEAPTSPGAIVFQDGSTLLAQLTEIGLLNSGEPTSYIQMTTMQASLPKTVETYKKSRENVQKDSQYADASQKIDGPSKQVEAVALDTQQRYGVYERALQYNFNDDVGGLESGQEATARLEQTESALNSIKSGKSPAKSTNGSVSVTISTPRNITQELDKSIRCLIELKQQQGSLTDKATQCEETYQAAKSAMLQDISNIASNDNTKKAYTDFATSLRLFKK